MAVTFALSYLFHFSCAAHLISSVTVCSHLNSFLRSSYSRSLLAIYFYSRLFDALLLPTMPWLRRRQVFEIDDQEWYVMLFLAGLHLWSFSSISFSLCRLYHLLLALLFFPTSLLPFSPHLLSTPPTSITSPQTSLSLSLSYTSMLTNKPKKVPSLPPLSHPERPDPNLDHSPPALHSPRHPRRLRPPRPAASAPSLLHLHRLLRRRRRPHARHRAPRQRLAPRRPRQRRRR